MTLKAIQFSDLYLGETNCWLTGVPESLDPVPAPPECTEELRALRAACTKLFEEKKKPEFALRVDDVSYRASLLQSMREDVFVLRRFPDAVPQITELGLHPHYVNLLMTPKLRGLVLIAGAFAQGKTTTASAMVAARANKFGGVAVCIEDPPEMPLEGRHGEGVCYQRWVDSGGFGNECRLVARWAPSMIFLGEIRDAETATEALRASISGRLIICTIHSPSARTAIDRLYTLANGTAGSGEDVSVLMASGLSGVLHQRLEGDTFRRPVVEMLWIDGSDDVGLRSLIKQRKFDQLDNEITLQRNRLLMHMRVPV